MPQKTLLIVSAGIEACHGVCRAQELGYRVVVSDRDPSAPGFSIADDGIEASTYDAVATACAAAKYSRTKHKIDGVIAIGADVPLTVAAVAQRLGLQSISIEAAKLAQDKLAMKQRFLEQGVPIPWFAPLPRAQDLKSLVEKNGLGFVVKPVDSRGGRGVQKLNASLDPLDAWEYAAAQSPTGRVMVEQFLEGPQISSESIILNGHGFTPGFSDRNYEFLESFAPYFIENGGDLPSALPVDAQDALRATAEAAGRALGITTGNIKGDLVWHNGQPYVIELAARASGGYFCTREIPLNTGVDFIGAVIRIALGEIVLPSDLTPKFNRSVVQRYLFPKPGRIVSISGEAQARAMPGVEELLVTVQPGGVIRQPTDSNCTAAMVLTTGDTGLQALQRAQAALAQLKIETAAP
jgi:biotin carboxylase